MPAGASPQPLSPAEEQTWRALVRLMVQLPRAVDDDMVRRSGYSLTRYVVLMRLSEAPGRSLRMSALAGAASISPSRLTRIVQAMVRDGLVTRHPTPDDARAGIATLTDAGMDQLRAVWPAHLAGVRALVVDHLDAADLHDLHRIAARLLAVLDGTASAPAAHHLPLPPRKVNP